MNKETVDILRLLDEGKRIQIKPKGYSMYPMLVPGRDAAIIIKADVNNVKRGNVVLYRRDGGMLVLHRIWKTSEEGIYLVGDNQVDIEGPLSKVQVKGILVAFVRKGKTISADNLLYRFISRGWLSLRPWRNLIKKPLAKVKKCFRV